MTSTFRVLRTSDDTQFYWELVNTDGATLCTSGEPYDDFGDCLAGLYVFRGRAAESPLNDRTRKGAQDRIAETEFELVPDEDGGFDWTFQQTTGEPLAAGRAHPDKAHVLADIKAAKATAPTAEVVVEADEPVDIEACNERGHETPHAKRYQIRIDRQRYTVDRPAMKGRELLALAGKDPVTRFRLDQKLRGGQARKIGYDESVSFCAPGVERFMTVPLDQHEGAVAVLELRREVMLPDHDVEYLDARGLPWETIVDEQRLFILVHDFPLPDGYDAGTVTVALMIPPGYPTVEFDMVYFDPPVVRADRKPIGALSTLIIDGAAFQRWSRHRTQQNPWRLGLDDVSTHLALVEEWLEQEFVKRPRHA
ncbi:MAG TPA: multiubiquitin domain-containing protein, partial [Rhodothermales bacterium]|nr:multiubiquitin domain-containing protein [Rhodothermales bacterium]